MKIPISYRLLASFFVLDLNGGKINAVLYDTRDPLRLQRDLERLLAITLDAKYTDRKTITIQAQGERELRIGYLPDRACQGGR